MWGGAALVGAAHCPLQGAGRVAASPSERWFPQPLTCVADGQHYQAYMCSCLPLCGIGQWLTMTSWSTTFDQSTRTLKSSSVWSSDTPDQCARALNGIVERRQPCRGRCPLIASCALIGRCARQRRPLGGGSQPLPLQVPQCRTQVQPNKCRERNALWRFL